MFKYRKLSTSNNCFTTPKIPPKKKNKHYENLQQSQKQEEQNQFNNNCFKQLHFKLKGQNEVNRLTHKHFWPKMANYKKTHTDICWPKCSNCVTFSICHSFMHSYGDYKWLNLGGGGGGGVANAHRWLAGCRTCTLASFLK